jgi:hypothetical protein
MLAELVWCRWTNDLPVIAQHRQLCFPSPAPHNLMLAAAAAAAAAVLQLMLLVNVTVLDKGCEDLLQLDRPGMEGLHM